MSTKKSANYSRLRMIATIPGLFHFNNDDVLAEPADTLTLNLKIDDKVLKNIIMLYFPDSPYEFSVIPPVILGEYDLTILG